MIKGDMMNDKITMIELFSGIGAQERALRSLGIPYEITNTCDCDKDAVLSYAAMRFNLEDEMKTFDFPSKEQMIEELQTKNLGFDFEHKHVHTINMRMNENKVKKYYLADNLSKNLGDISQVDRLPYSDIWTYSFPCTDLSVAGKGEGMVNKCECGYSWPIDFSDSNDALICPECGKTVSRSTRSGLLGQVQRLLTTAKSENTLPKYLLLENVKNLVGKKFKPQFDSWVNWLDNIGYSTYYKVLNAKNYGIPQNRERVFAISIRKDIDNGFTFPEEIPLTTRLKDILETNVAEKYYLPDERIEKILNSSFMMDRKKNTNDINVIGNYMPSGHDASRVVGIDGVAPCVKENHGTVTAIAEPQVERVGQASNEGSQCGTVYSTDGLAPTLIAGCHGYAMGYITEEQKPFIVASRGRNPENPSDRTTGSPTEQRFEPNTKGITNTITTVQKDNYVCEPIAIIEDQFPDSRDARIYKNYSPTLHASNCIGLKVADGNTEDINPVRLGNIYGEQFGTGYAGNVWDENAISPTIMTMQGGNRQPLIVDNIKWRIRKLTAKECWRLMGFTDSDADKSAKYVSASAQYKQAGNSICTSCLVALFSSLLLEDGYKSEIWSKYLIDYNS